MDGPLIVLFKQDRADRANDRLDPLRGSIVRKNPDNVRPALDFAVQSPDRIGRMELSPVGGGEIHEGQDVFFGLVHESGEFGVAHA